MITFNTLSGGQEQGTNENRGAQQGNGAFSTPYHPNISLMTLDSISRYESTAPAPPASASIVERPANKLLDYKPSVQRSNSFSRLLGRSDSKRSQKVNGQELPTSPKHSKVSCMMCEQAVRTHD
jgi:hypothetical protein